MRASAPRAAVWGAGPCLKPRVLNIFCSMGTFSISLKSLNLFSKYFFFFLNLTFKSDLLKNVFYFLKVFIEFITILSLC